MREKKTHKKRNQSTQHPPHIALPLTLPQLALSRSPVGMQKPLLDGLGEDGRVRYVEGVEDDRWERVRAEESLQGCGVGVDICVQAATT